MNMDKVSDKKRKGGKAWIVLASVAIIFLLVWLGINFVNSGKSKANTQITSLQDSSSEEISEEYIKAVIPVFDSTDNYVMLSDSKDLNIAIDGEAGSGKRMVFSGRRINIAVTGVDSRLGTRTRHADANHVISLLIDSGKIEIYSVPRDTYADCGYDDTTGQNKLTILRAAHGREAYLKELARITRLDKMHYWVEFGFSQAMGLIEFLGYSDAPNTLQVLRSRRGLGGDDYQRVYNQAQFIKQAMVRQFSRFDGSIGSLLMRGVLSIVETNLTYNIASDLYDKMKAASFPRHGSDVSVYIRPTMPIKFKVYDFQDDATLSELRRKIEGFNLHRLKEFDEALTPHTDPARILDRALAKAVKDTAKNPTLSINALKVLFDQRAWFQVRNVEDRIRIRDEMGKVLANSYTKKKLYKEAGEVQKVIEHEKAIFKSTPNTDNSKLKTKDTIGARQ